MDYKAILKQHWGYDDFRGIQREIIESVGEGHDTLGLMPTGGGKSVTFQVPALARPGLCLVVTPLISLMKDQVAHLRARGIKAAAVHAGMSREQVVTALENCIFGDYKFLYVSPERLGTEIFQVKLRRMKVNLIAVDESHCISQWGYDFRPAYLKIAQARKLLPGVPVLALTATATPEVARDICRQLAFGDDGRVFRMSFGRGNLAYVVRKTEDKKEELFRILGRVEGSAIVYTRSRKRAREVAGLLAGRGVTATFYHAGLNDDARDRRQKSWVAGESRVMVATNAFGMGIDKPDVRLVIHLDLPDSPEAYFQEAGRAGRDGRKAYAVLLYAKSDRATLERRVAYAFPDKEYVRRVYEDMNYYFQMAMGDGLGCTFAFDLDEFCYAFKHFPVLADSALKILARAGYIEYTDEQDNASRLLFTVRRDELYRLREHDDDTERLLRVLLRTYSGLFSDYVYVSEESLAARSGLSPQQVYETLSALDRRRVVRYVPRKKTPYIVYTRERQEADRLVFTREVYEDRKAAYAARVKAMTDYAASDDQCRSRMLLRYFGEDGGHDCGQCDVCVARRRLHALGSEELRALESRLGELLRDGPLPAVEVVSRLEAVCEGAEEAVAYFLSEEVIRVRDGFLSLCAPSSGKGR